MRASRWVLIALCAITMMLGGLAMETASSPIQASAAAEESTPVVGGPDDCVTFTLQPDTVESSADGAPTSCCPPVYTIVPDSTPDLETAELGSTDPCCDQPTWSAEGLTSAEGSPVDPCGPPPNPCSDDPYRSTQLRLQSADLEGPGPICCIDAPGRVMDGAVAQSAELHGPIGGGLCVPVCAIPLYIPVTDTRDVASADVGPGGGFPPCIPICGTGIDQPLVTSADVRDGHEGGPGGLPPCVPICAPGNPTSTATLQSSNLEDQGGPVCILPCGPVDLVEFGYTADPLVSSANLGHSEGPTAPPCVPPCINPDIPLTGATISSENMHRPGGPPPIQPCIPPCPNEMPNTALPLQSADGAPESGYIILCDPCVDDGIYGSAGLASDTPTSPTSPVEEPVLLLDGDCDDVPRDIDCDDTDDTIKNTTVDDADCDLVPTSTDCNDADPAVTNTNENDADCDSIPTADDCNDMDATNLCFSLEDPYTCGQGFRGSLTGGTAPYNVSYTFTPSAGGATTMLPTFLVVAAGAFTTPDGYIDYDVLRGPHQVTVSAMDMNARTTSVSFAVNLTTVCETVPVAPLLPGINDDQVEEILDIVVARRDAQTPKVTSELDAVTAAPVGATSSGGALALTGTASRMLAMLALVFLGFGTTFVGTDRLRKLLPGESD